MQSKKIEERTKRSLRRPIPPPAERDLLSDPEGAFLLGVGLTKFQAIQRSPGFPAPRWIGPRGKRHARRELLAWANARRERP